MTIEINAKQAMSIGQAIALINRLKDYKESEIKQAEERNNLEDIEAKVHAIDTINRTIAELENII